MAVYNPYDGLDIQSMSKIMSFTHGHCKNQTHFDNYITAGYRHMPISNYHVSKPYGRDNFNASLALNGTSDTVLYCPNSELGYSSIGHSGTFSYYLHYCTVGSEYESGTDEEEVAARWNWKTQLQKIFSLLLYDDGGGVTLNHPNYTINEHQGYENMYEDKLLNWFYKLLDYDSRVLGIEVVNGGGASSSYGSHAVGFWDKILKTGRKCYGFFTPDWDVTKRLTNCKGRNMLLVDNVDEHECLRAYRLGHFFGKTGTTDITLAKADFNKETREYSVIMPNAERIALVVDGVYTWYDSDRFTAVIPIGSTYCRAEGYKADSTDAETGKDEVFTQAVMLRITTGKKKSDDMLMFLK